MVRHYTGIAAETQRPPDRHRPATTRRARRGCVI